MAGGFLRRIRSLFCEQGKLSDLLLLCSTFILLRTKFVSVQILTPRPCVNDWKYFSWAGEVAQWLRALAALAEDPAPTWPLIINVCTYNSRAFTDLSGVFGYCTHTVHRHTCSQNTQIQHNNRKHLREDCLIMVKKGWCDLELKRSKKSSFPLSDGKPGHSHISIS